MVAQAPRVLGEDDATAVGVAEVGEEEDGGRGDGRVIEVDEDR